MQITQELKQSLRKLRLSGIVALLPERLSYAKKSKLGYGEFLELIMFDEVERRAGSRVDKQLKRSGINSDETLERFDWDAPIEVDSEQIRSLFCLSFTDQSENVIFSGPVGVGKTYLANALGHALIRSGKKVLMIRAETMLKRLHQSRADYSFEREIIKFITPDILIIDDFGLRALTEQQSTDFYEIIVERYKKASTIITSNRTVDEWMDLFHDPILANSTLDRLAHCAHQIIIDGDSYRKFKPGKRNLS